MRSREINFYYATLTLREALFLIGVGVKGLIGIGNPAIGPHTAKFQKEFAAQIGAKCAFTFGSARSALYAILKAMAIGPGDEVLLSGFTCEVVPNAIIYAGAKPVYADIDIRDFNIDPADMERKITPNTRAIIVQHTFGVPAAIEEIIEIARKHNLMVIEDCAVALGARYAEKPVGLFGDAAIFSMELSKTLTTGWGGVAVVTDEILLRNLKDYYKGLEHLPAGQLALRSIQTGLAYFLYHPCLYGLAKYALALLFKTGVFHKSTQTEELKAQMPSGYLTLLSKAQCRLGISQLGKLSKILENSRNIALIYEDILAQAGARVQRCLRKDALPTYLRYSFLVDDREKAISFFHSRGIELGHWFEGVFYDDPKRRRLYHYEEGTCPVSELISKHVVNLPTHIRLTRNDVTKIVEVLRGYLTSHPEDTRVDSTKLKETGAILKAVGAQRHVASFDTN